MAVGPFASMVSECPPSHQDPSATRFQPMRIHVADHPLIAHKLTTLRDQRTD